MPSYSEISQWTEKLGENKRSLESSEKKKARGRSQLFTLNRCWVAKERQAKTTQSEGRMESVGDDRGKGLPTVEQKRGRERFPRNEKQAGDGSERERLKGTGLQRSFLRQY